MKTLILTALTFTGIALCTPEAQARDRRHDRHDHGSYGRGYSSYGHSYYRGGCETRGYYTHSYHRPAPRYYYSSPSRYHYSERCVPERRYSFRPPLISFLFGF